LAKVEADKIVAREPQPRPAEIAAVAS